MLDQIWTAAQEQEEDGAESGAATDLAVEQHRHQQSQEDAHRHRQDTEQDGVAGGFPELYVLEHFHVVIDALKLEHAEGQRFGEAHVDGFNKGIDVQNQQADDGGRHHDEAPHRTVAGKFRCLLHYASSS